MSSHSTVNPGGLAVLSIAALICLSLAILAGRRAQLPGGWGRRPPRNGAGARRFLTVFPAGLALFLLISPWVIRYRPWKEAAAYLIVGGGVALVAAGLGVRRYGMPNDALTDGGGEGDNRDR